MSRIKTHPGEVLREDFLRPMGLNANLLSKAIGVPRNRITMILRGERGVTPDTALRLAQFFGTSAEVWTNLQMAHDLSVIEAHSPEIKNITAFVAAE